MLSNIGSWASIVALPITVWVLVESFRIKQHFSTRARIPEIKKALGETSLAYLSNLKDGGDLNFAHAELAKMLALLKSLQAKPISKKLASLHEVVTRISRVSRLRITDRNELWAAYNSIIEITTSLDQVERDMSWS
jgi:hypothetical protein